MPVARFLGHSAWEIRHQDVRVLIDPFITGNPTAPAPAGELEATAILLTHAHNDHVGDAIEIASRTGATIVAIYELAVWSASQGVSAHPMSIGGAHTFPWGWVKMTPAWHGSAWQGADGAFVSLGTPAGFLLRIGGTCVYHSGDTGLFGDMALIGRAGIDLALLPIGDNFTMGPEDALEAVRLLRPARVAPMHYNTFPIIEQDPVAWAERVARETGVEAVVLRPGEELHF